MYYKFRQNNSGGYFIIDDDVSQTVILEADSAYEANKKAEDIGIYFDGVHCKIDCKCCGDRWHEVGFSDGKQNLSEFDTDYMFGWSDYCFLYLKDGRKLKLKKEEFEALASSKI